MDQSKNETWQFTVRPGQADRVYLVVDGHTAASRWVPMHQPADQPGLWTITAEIAPGRSRVRYFTETNGAFLNCGGAGLYGERTSDANPAVHLDDMSMAASA
jgi:1,4-alpha-glucan branching enzyme